jgi:hypothetical protein
MPAHLKSFMRNSDVYKKKITMPFLAFEKRAVTLLHVADVSAVAKSFVRTINIAAITSVLQQQLMSLP